MANLALHLAIAAVLGAVCGFLTFRNAGRQGIEEDPRIIGAGAGAIVAVAYIIVIYVFW